MYVITLAILLFGVATVTSGVWMTGGFSHGNPEFDQGCYCHNNNIAVWVNGTGDGNGGSFFGPFTAGSSFHLLINTDNAHVTGVVPALQQWESNQTDNAKFTISPAQVTDNSAADQNKTAGGILVLYKITTPTTAGTYVLTLYAQGSLLQPIAIQVAGGSTSTTTSSTTPAAHSTPSPTSTTSSTISSSTSTTQSTSSTSSASSTSS